MMEEQLVQQIKVAEAEIRNLEGQLIRLIGSVDDDEIIDDQLQSEIDHFNSRLKVAVSFLYEHQKNLNNH